MLKNKKGIAYIYVCVIVIFMASLLSVTILYMGLTAQVQIQKRDVQKKLDSYVSYYATESYNAIKQGNRYNDHMDYDAFSNGIYRSLGFAGDTADVYEYDNAGCAMTRPEVTVLKGDGFGLTLRYTAIFPITWNGHSYSDLEVPVMVSSYYKFK